jgi:hypothetical protein
VWSSAALTIDAYPGQVVSRQLVYGSIANAAGVDVWDVDGDDLEFSEVATAVLSQLGLSISSTGLIAGTISAEAEPQSLTFRVSASDGQLSANKTGTVRVFAVTDTQTDWETRSRGDGVFWACNFAEWIRGIPGYTSQPVSGFPAGQSGRRETTIESIYQVPSNESRTLANDKINGNLGDGKGRMWLDTNPQISGKVLRIRVRGLYSVGGNGDYNLLPWAWVPLDYADAEEGTGQPNERRGIANTMGAGAILPFVETRIDINPDTGLPYTSSVNPANRPMIRHFYLQYQMWVPDSWNWYRPRTWSDEFTTGVDRGNRATKQVFFNGGESDGQFALGLSENTGSIRAIYKDGTSFGNAAKEISTGTGRFDFPHSAINIASAPEPVSGAGVEGYMVKYGPSAKPLVYGDGMRVNGVAVSPFAGWRPPTDPIVGGNGNYPAPGNSLTNPARNYPYGGWPTDGSKPFPLMGWTDAAAAGILRPGRMHTIEVMFTAQASAPINQAGRIPSQKNPIGPCFVACWAAPTGEPPQLLWHTGSGDSAYPALSRSRALHRGSGNLDTTTADDYCILKSQDNSTAEDRSNCGFMVVGALDGFPEPTATEFYALRANPTGRLEGPYVGNSSNKAVDPGNMDNWGAYLAMGFARGDLRTAAPMDTGTLNKSAWQYIVEKTEPASALGFPNAFLTVPNSYQNGVTNVSAWVHKFTMLEPMPLAPRARSADYLGDCFNQKFTHDWLTPLGIEIGYGEIIFSMKPIPFPGHLGTPLARPWMP